MKQQLLTLHDVRVDLADGRPLVDSVRLTVAAGEAVGMVGESGSGKSMTVKAAMRLTARGLTVSGSVLFDGHDVRAFDRRALARYRAHDVGVIHQDARAHVNPSQTIGTFVTEAVIASGQVSRDQAHEAAVGLMREVGIKDAERRMRQYPHELSGGLLQRVMIVAALLPGPRLIFADEPTTALDVTVQSDVMAVLLEQIRDRGAGLLFITHDLDLAAAVTDRLAVMYAGRVMESGASAELYERPLHPYTAGLLASRPSTQRVRRLHVIPGRPAAAYEAGEGCPFAPRCSLADDRCRGERPELRDFQGRNVACHRAEETTELLETSAS